MNFSTINTKNTEYSTINKTQFVDGHIGYLNTQLGRVERHSCSDIEYIDMDFRYPYMMFFEMFRDSDSTFVLISNDGTEIVFFTEDARMIECHIGRHSAIVKPLTNRLLDKVISEFESNDDNSYYELLDFLDSLYDNNEINENLDFINLYKERSQFKTTDIDSVLSKILPNIKQSTNYMKRKEMRK